MLTTARTLERVVKEGRRAPSVKILLRVPADLLERVDRFVALENARAGYEGAITRTHVLRAFVERGIAQAEREQKLGKRRRQPPSK